MQFSMKNLDQLSLSEMEELLSSSRKVTWPTEDTEARYTWIAPVPKAQRHAKLGNKDTKINEKFHVQFRVESFNLPNHANLGGPGTNISVDGSVGRITSVGDPRQIQFGLRSCCSDTTPGLLLTNPVEETGARREADAEILGYGLADIRQAGTSAERDTGFRSWTVTK